MGVIDYLEDVKVLVGAARAKPPLPESPGCLPLLVQTQAINRPEAIALLCEENTITWKALNEQANRIAKRLQHDSISKGDCVSLFMQNRIEFVVCMLAIQKLGAIAGMIGGISVTLFYVFQHKGIMFIPGTAFLGDTPANWFMGIEPNAFGVVGAIMNFAVAFAVSKVTAAPPQEVQDLVEHIRVPIGSSEATGH